MRAALARFHAGYRPLAVPSLAQFLGQVARRIEEIERPDVRGRIDGAQAALGGEPSALVRHWVAERFAREQEDERTLLQSEAASVAQTMNLMQDRDEYYRMRCCTA
jgi:hypothetical protein